MASIQIQVNDFVYQLNIPLQSPCTPPQILNLITGKCETPSGLCTPPQVLNPLTGKCETPSGLCTLPQIFNPTTQKCEYPSGEVFITAKKISISTLRNAFRTQEIPIIVVATCTNPPTPIKGEDASLHIDGKIVDTKTVIDGTVSFKYMFKEAGLHNVRVTIPRSTACDTEGSSSVQIDVSAEVPSTLERLQVERKAQEEITAEIERIRKRTRETIGGI